jgi:hypothetical protein
MAANTLAGLRRELDHDGCAYGQVSRERLSHVVDAVEGMERKLNYILGAVGLQLLGFFIGVVVYLLQRAH